MRVISRALALLTASILVTAGVALAGGTVKGIGTLVEKDLRAGTISIEGHVYQVNDRTVIRDLEGARITLAQVPVPEAGAKPGAVELVVGKFDAVAARGKLVLVSLDLSEPPR
jgi:hypothetical protein